MAQIISSSRSEFVKNVIEKYSENRVGQYSKYLDTDPMFVTYYAINTAHSRADLGTDAIQEPLGPASPIRYNKIENFPIYIRGGFEPETIAEDGYISNDMEINDITILPNTVIPRPYDHIVINLPGMVPFMLRVNSFRNMTIQSNDFYGASAHVVDFGKGNTEGIDKQVVETYSCVYENIGTNNSCFIRSDVYDTSNDLKEAIIEMTKVYDSLYFNEETCSYIYNDQFYRQDNMVVDPSIDLRQLDRTRHYSLPWDYTVIYPERWGREYLYGDRKKFRCFMEVNRNLGSPTIYDLYMTKFIMESGLFFDGANYDTTSVLVYEDLLPITFETDFKRTLWYAVITKSTKILSENLHYYISPIRKDMSAIVLSRMPSPMSIGLAKYNPRPCDNCPANEYFAKALLMDLKNGRKTDCECDCEDQDQNFVNLESVIENPDKDFNKDNVSLKEYTATKKTDEPEEELSEVEKMIAYFNDIIYNYFYDIEGEIDTSRLIQWAIEPSFTAFEYLPIILYILKKKYSGYLVKLS